MYLANERTLIHWFNTATTLAGLGSALLALDKPDDHSLAPVALFTLFIAALVVIFAPLCFWGRGDNIRNRRNTRWDDPHGPFVVGIGIFIAFTLQFVFVLKATSSVDSDE